MFARCGHKPKAVGSAHHQAREDQVAGQDADHEHGVPEAEIAVPGVAEVGEDVEPFPVDRNVRGDFFRGRGGGQQADGYHHDDAEGPVDEGAHHETRDAGEPEVEHDDFEECAAGQAERDGEGGGFGVGAFPEDAGEEYGRERRGKVGVEVLDVVYRCA